jgi:hypothetical protein
VFIVLSFTVLNCVFCCEHDTAKSSAKIELIILLFIFGGYKNHGFRIDAIALSCGWWSIVKNMTQVTFTGSAQDFYTTHAMTVVGTHQNFIVVVGFIKTGPAATRIVFGFGGEKQGAASRT